MHLNAFVTIPVKFKNPDDKVFEELGLDVPEDEDYIIDTKVNPDEVQLYYTNYIGTVNFILKGDSSPYTAMLTQQEFEHKMFKE